MNETKFGSVVCPSCKEQQWSIADCKYVNLFGHCWSEDKLKWQKGELPLEIFEQREAQASEI